MRCQLLPEVQWQEADDGEGDGEGDGVDEMNMAVLYYWGGFGKKERLEEPASFPSYFEVEITSKDSYRHTAEWKTFFFSLPAHGNYFSFHGIDREK